MLILNEQCSGFGQTPKNDFLNGMSLLKLIFINIIDGSFDFGLKIV